MELVKRGPPRTRAAQISHRNAYAMPAAATVRRGRALVSSMARNTYAPAMPSRALPSTGKRFPGCAGGSTAADAAASADSTSAKGCGQSAAGGCSRASTRCSSASRRFLSRSISSGRSFIMHARSFAGVPNQSPAATWCRLFSGHGGSNLTSTHRKSSGRMVNPMATSKPSRVTSAIL